MHLSFAFEKMYIIHHSAVDLSVGLDESVSYAPVDVSKQFLNNPNKQRTFSTDIISYHV